MEQLLIHIDGDVKKELKTKASLEGITLKHAVTIAIKKYLGIEIGPEAAREGIPLKCKKCGVEWKSTKIDPKACPGCKSYFWQEVRSHGFLHECDACHFAWESRKEKPAVCPSCRTYNWQKDNPAILYKQFCDIYRRLYLTVPEVAAMLGTTADKLIPYIKGETPVTRPQLDALVAAAEKNKIIQNNP